MKKNIVLLLMVFYIVLTAKAQHSALLKADSIIAKKIINSVSTENIISEATALYRLYIQIDLEKRADKAHIIKVTIGNDTTSTIQNLALDLKKVLLDKDFDVYIKQKEPISVVVFPVTLVINGYPKASLTLRDICDPILSGETYLGSLLTHEKGRYYIAPLGVKLLLMSKIKYY